MERTSEQRTYSIEEAATYLDISITTLRRRDTQGVIDAERTDGGHRRYSEEILDELKREMMINKLKSKALSFEQFSNSKTNLLFFGNKETGKSNLATKFVKKWLEKGEKGIVLGKEKDWEFQQIFEGSSWNQVFKKLNFHPLHIPLGMNAKEWSQCLFETFDEVHRISTSLQSIFETFYLHHPDPANQTFLNLTFEVYESLIHHPREQIKDIIPMLRELVYWEQEADHEILNSSLSDIWKIDSVITYVLFEESPQQMCELILGPLLLNYYLYIHLSSSRYESPNFVCIDQYDSSLFSRSIRSRSRLKQYLKNSRYIEGKVMVVADDPNDFIDDFKKEVGSIGFFNSQNFLNLISQFDRSLEIIPLLKKGEALVCQGSGSKIISPYSLYIESEAEYELNL